MSLLQPTAAAAVREGLATMKQRTMQRAVILLCACGAITLACSSQGAQAPALSAGASGGASGNAGVAAVPAAAGNGGRAGSTAASPVAGSNATPVVGGAGGSTQPPALPAAGNGGSAAGRSGASGTEAAGSSGASGAAGMSGAAGSTPPVPAEHFSFFVTSWAAMQRLSKSSDGFGGDLRYGEADGLAGADKICTEIAETSMPGSGAKGWRAFLSVTKGPTGQPVHAIDRVGEGPWYDRRGRLVSMNKTELVKQRPGGADSTIINDLPNEDGIPNHAPDGTQVDNHDILTGTNNMGQLYSPDWAFTCHDWVSKEGRDGTPRVGHSWPRMGGGGRPPRGGAAGGGSGAAGTGGNFVPPPLGGRGGPLGGDFDTANWMSALTEAGCAAGASLVEMGPPNPDIPTVGSGGGYGGIYCFALKP